MRDKAGQLYSAIGGVLAGAGSSTMLAGGPTGFAGWIVGGGIVAGAVMVLGTYMLLASMAGWWLPWRKSSLAIVISTAQQLSGEIAIWAGERRGMESDFGPHPDTWDRDIARNNRQSQDTITRWNERFAVKALVAYDQLVAHGAEDATTLGRGRSLFEHPTNRLGIEEAGRALGVMAAHLEAKTMSRD